MDASGIPTLSENSLTDMNNAGTTQGYQGDSRLNEVRSIKLPRPFWRDTAARYFTVAEMTFALHRITSDETKFRHIVINLDRDLLSIVGDIIDSPPINGKYEAIKQRIINSLSESQETRIQKLLRQATSAR